jgi:hypothetical protein
MATTCKGTTEAAELFEFDGEVAEFSLFVFADGTMLTGA